MVNIRDAREEDIAPLLEIYNDVIATSTAIYRDDPSTLEDRRSWWKQRIEQGYPVLVAIVEGEMVGFASFSDFRAWPGYRFTVEDTVHVRADKRGQRVGTALVQDLAKRATGLGKHVMIAGVDADNIASLALHERLGFTRVAHFREVGFKFGRWLDLVFLQLTL